MENYYKLCSNCGEIVEAGYKSCNKCGSLGIFIPIGEKTGANMARAIRQLITIKSLTISPTVQKDQELKMELEYPCNIHKLRETSIKVIQGQLPPKYVEGVPYVINLVDGDGKTMETWKIPYEPGKSRPSLGKGKRIAIKSPHNPNHLIPLIIEDITITPMYVRVMARKEVDGKVYDIGYRVELA